MPSAVVTVSQELEVHVHVAQARHDRHAVGVDDCHAGRNGHLRCRAHVENAVTGDENDAVFQERAAKAVQHPPPRQGQGGLLCAGVEGKDQSEGSGEPHSRSGER